MDFSTPQQIAFMLPMLLFAFVAHEYAHGYAALRQGDTTAYQLGRLTWNPLKHIDPMMTIVIPAISLAVGGFLFGGAKPIPVNPRNFRHFKRGDIIVSLAGVTTNLLIALACALLIVPIGLLGRAVPAAAEALSILQVMLRFGILINLFLCLFNLMPIPPLDGSHVFKYLLPPAWSLQYQRLGQYGFGILLLFMFVGRGVITAWMTPAFLLDGLLLGAVRDFILVSQWTS